MLVRVGTEVVAQSDHEVHVRRIARVPLGQIVLVLGCADVVVERTRDVGHGHEAASAHDGANRVAEGVARELLDTSVDWHLQGAREKTHV